MKDEELYDSIDSSQNIIQEYFGLSILKFLGLLFIVLGFGIYLGDILYGTSSLEVLFNLQDYEDYLTREIFQLKESNAELQRELFELKEISAQEQGE